MITVVVVCTIADAKVQTGYNCYNVYFYGCLLIMGIAAISPIAYRAFSGSGFLHLRLIIEEGKTLSCRVQRIFAVPVSYEASAIPKRRTE